MGVSSKKGEPLKFLTGWKEIARYLGKGVRTVQRYEREMSLPVRRPAGRSHAAVVATKVELDAWVAASPFRTVSYLPKAPLNTSDFTKSVGNQIEVMRGLREQMRELRNEVISTVALLRESVQNAENEMLKSYRKGPPVSTADFDFYNKPSFSLPVTRIPGKAS
jgi:hypothetical protein